MRLNDELEGPDEAVTEQIAVHVLRILKEMRRQREAFESCREEFREVYATVRRLARSVKLSRTSGAMPVICSDIRDVLAVEFS